MPNNWAISAPPGSKALYDDADLMLKHVVPVTMLRQMTRSKLQGSKSTAYDQSTRTERIIQSYVQTAVERVVPDERGIEEGAEEIEDFWIGWKKLLNGLQETVALLFLRLTSVLNFSPERHDIIWRSKELRCRPPFPADILFQPAVLQATDAIDLKGFKSGIENLRSIATTTSAAD
ncbi:hypothetical protein PS6_002129 [Mucor atramentarius]